MERHVFLSRIITAVLTFGIGLITLWQTAKLPFGALNRIQAGFFPKIFGTLLLVLSIIMLADLLRIRKKGTVEEETSKEEIVEIRGAVLVCGVFLLFFIINYLLGYIAATLVSVGALGFILGLRGWRLAMLAVGTSATIWILFQQWMEIRLPTGLWF